METDTELPQGKRLAPERIRALKEQQRDNTLGVIDLLKEHGVAEELVEQICGVFSENAKIGGLLSDNELAMLLKFSHAAIRFKDQARILENLLLDIFDVCKNHGFQDPLQKHHDYFVPLWEWMHEGAPKPEKPDLTYGSLPTSFDLPTDDDRWNWRN